MEKDLNEQRKAVYKVGSFKLHLVDRLAEVIKGKGCKELKLKLKLGGLTVKSLEIDPMELGCVLVHWEPDHTISTKSDPFCSAYMLDTVDIEELIKAAEAAKA
jgi:hypothetical protein